MSKREWQPYIETLRQRRRKAQQQREARYQRAWQLAREAAELLRREYGATRVVVFGSLLRPSMFDDRSDVDIATQGIQPQDTLRAMSAVAYLDNQIEVNLVDVNTCQPGILHAIEREGVDI